MMNAAAEPRMGRMVTAMVTPFAADGSIDLDAARCLATHLVEVQGNDALVVNGTTGESPTTTEDEKFALVQAVLDVVGDRCTVIAGVGSFDTAHTVRMARRAADVGAPALLVVTPYYSKPTQTGIIGHFTAVAEATDLPVMMYDIPHRTGVAMAPQTLVSLSQHPNLVAVKDAKGDLVSSSEVMAATDLDYYSGDDALTLPLLSLGAVGVVGTSTHLTGRGMRAVIEAFLSGDRELALRLHRRWLPAFTSVFAAPGATMVKAALARCGQVAGAQLQPTVRLPMVEPAPDLVDAFLAAVQAAEQG